MFIIKGRHFEILIHLLKHKKTTYKQLAQNFEVSIKTIERDINLLSAIGIPVYCIRGSGGGVYIEENYKFGTSFFTNEDIHEIIFALKIMDSLSATPKSNSIINKLCLLTPESSLVFESDAEQYLSIDLLCEKINVENWVYEKIDYCLDNEVLAIINGFLSVAPIGYVLKTDGLYLYCYADAYKMIKCKSINTLEITEIPFKREFISYEEYKNCSR